MSWSGRSSGTADEKLLLELPQAESSSSKTDRGLSSNKVLHKSVHNYLIRYGNIWESVDEYHEEILPGRLDLIVSTLEANPKPEWIYIYGQSNPCAEKLLERFPNSFIDTWPSGTNARDPRVYQLEITNDRIVRLIHGPFFKRGMSHAAIETLAQDLQTQFD